MRRRADPDDYGDTYPDELSTYTGSRDREPHDDSGEAEESISFDDIPPDIADLFVRETSERVDDFDFTRFYDRENAADSYAAYAKEQPQGWGWVFDVETNEWHSVFLNGSDVDDDDLDDKQISYNAIPAKIRVSFINVVPFGIDAYDFESFYDWSRDAVSYRAHLKQGVTEERSKDDAWFFDIDEDRWRPASGYALRSPTGSSR